jgi:NADPH:quinone reductase-like Zn-dependent oxidoreductase
MGLSPARETKEQAVEMVLQARPSGVLPKQNVLVDGGRSGVGMNS